MLAEYLFAPPRHRRRGRAAPSGARQLCVRRNISHCRRPAPLHFLALPPAPCHPGGSLRALLFLGVGDVLNRRNLILGSGAALAGAGVVAPGFALAAGEGIHLPEAGIDTRPITVTAGPEGGNRVAMTFDDGPHPRHTPVLLDLLRARRIRATFYLIGRNVARYPDIVKRMVDEGHEIGNHTWRHPHLTGLGRASVLRELDRTSEVVYKAVQRIPVTMRPPYGALLPSQRRMIVAERDMPTILWSVDPQDWRRPGMQIVAERIIAGARPGAIVLSHDIHAQTVKAMPATLDALRERGFGFATVSMILGQRDWSKLRWRLPRDLQAKR